MDARTQLDLLILIMMILFLSYPLYLFFKYLDSRQEQRESEERIKKEQLKREYEDQLIKQINEKRQEIQHALVSYNSIIDNERYISKKEYPDWLSQRAQLKPLIEEYNTSTIQTEFDGVLQALFSAFKHGEYRISEKNRQYIETDLEKYRVFFDTLEDYPLTDSQRRAIVTDEKHNLVIAGAGTGKTSTIVGKAGYLIEKGRIQPHEILLISFAKQAKDEMDERVFTRLGQNLRVVTFHSLGLSIIGEVEGVVPSVSQLSTDNVKLRNTISGYIKEKSSDHKFLSKLNEYFSFHKTPYRSEYNFQSKGEYINYLRENDIRSLKGDRVKSLEECDIANFLYLHGVDYDYEADYEINTASSEHRQYKPDFYLPDHKIYIEHFSVDKFNNTAPFIDKRKYIADMAWKRKTHKDNNTTLIETYSWQKSENILLSNLEKKLLSAKVTFNRIAPERIFDTLNELGLVHPFTSLLTTFLNLFKSSRKSIQELIDLAKEQPNNSRYLAFIDIFSNIFVEYEQSLGYEIDFNDMINKAEDYIASGQYSSGFQYILVDEFQDISNSRCARVDQNPSTKLFCVGDDWQSIYRFTGSDVTLMTDFERFFDPCELLNLDKTFRFDNKICDFSTKFILKNPNQIKKHLTTLSQSESPSVTLIWSDSTEDSIAQSLIKIESTLKDYAEVLIIGRYNHQRPGNLHLLRERHPQLTIRYSTVHSSKGTQAEYVIVIGLTSKDYSFPSQIEDDPVLDLVLAKKEAITNAEERRLFYVAVTRAKKHLYLIANKNAPSAFVIELSQDGYELIVEGSRGDTEISCPECKTGFIIPRWGDYGKFFSCNNYPYCEYKPINCPSCGNGVLVRKPKSRHYKCTNSLCSFEPKNCPACKDGYLTVKEGPYSSFLGCINYPDCSYTEVEKCPQCNRGKLVVKQGPYSKFLGCSQYPKCRYTRPLR